MSQIAPHASRLDDYAQIVDTLDLVGQKYRVQRLLRGGLLLTLGFVVLTPLAGLAAHAAGAGGGAKLIGIVWIVLMAAAAGWWVVRPMLIRPRPERVARLIESRVDGLHNGLTNSLSLASAGDLQANPWTGLILGEIRQNADARSIDQAVRFGELRPLAIKIACAVALAAVATALLHGPIMHGWRQLLAPTAFVPKTGSAKIIDITPGDTTLLRGQALEITVSANAPADAVAQLFLGDDATPIQLQPVSAGSPGVASEPTDGGGDGLPVTGSTADAADGADGAGSADDQRERRFSYRIDIVDASTRYRVDLAGTQSRWFDVKVIDQVKLLQMSLTATPPAYTGQAATRIDLPAGDVARAPIAWPQGSRVELTATVDTPVDAALLQLGEAAPVATAGEEGTRFSVGFAVSSDTTAALLLRDAGGQIVARLPEPAVAIGVTPDLPPSITPRFPTADVAVPLDATLKIAAALRDDYGVSRVRVLVAQTPQGPLEPALDLPLGERATAYTLDYELKIKPELRRHGASIRVQIEATDNRQLTAASAAAAPVTADASPSGGAQVAGLGPQTTRSPVYEITFRDAAEIARQQAQRTDALRQALLDLLEKQRNLNEQTAGLQKLDSGALAPILLGQTGVRDRLDEVGRTFKFEPSDEIIQKTLLLLVKNPAQEAIDLASALPAERAEVQQKKLHDDLQGRQRVIIRTLENLLAVLNKTPVAESPATGRGGDLPTRAQASDELKKALDAYMKEQQRILDQTAPLAKKPVDSYDDGDKKNLADLLTAQEKLDAFMQEKIADFSKLAEQDMANASLLKELMEVYSEVTMAKDALKKQVTELAVSHEEAGLELAKEITSNLEKWLVDQPDRIKWDMEDPLTKTDTPMAELPEELEDMVGELMEQQEDLLDEAEDTNANWADSLDKGAGWDAMDGPIANMSAKGVTGNTLPNNNEMNGRSGEGRSGKSQGEMVEESASGKGGRNTPTRLDPTPFAQGQVNDQSKDPTGGATGGGKLSGQSGEGLEGPVPPEQKEALKRLAEKQAQIRNSAERLNLQYQLGRYDNFQLTQAIEMMRRLEADLNANRYDNALHRRDVLLDTLDTSRLLLGGEVHVQQDTSPQVSRKLESDIHQAMSGDLPPAWSDALKKYYEKLGRQ